VEYDLHCWADPGGEDIIVFLPAGWPASLRLSYRAWGPARLDGAKLSAFSGQAGDEPHTLRLSGKTYTLRFLRSEGLPTLWLELPETDLQAVNADPYKIKQAKGRLRIFSAEGKLLADDFLTLSGRGNATWAEEKKPYKLTLNHSLALLDMPKSKDWVLLSNPLDPSGLRNALLLDLARDMGLLSPAWRFADCFLNGSYRGLYQLCQAIAAGPAQLVDTADLAAATQAVNRRKLESYAAFGTPEDLQTGANGGIRGYAIPKDPADISGGYLLELDYSFRNIWRSNAFRTEGGSVLDIRAPSQASRAQISYIAGRFRRLEEALSAGEPLEGILDLPSWALYYVFQEWIKNSDGGLSSEYLYKPADRQSPLLFAGPVWDHDMTLGNFFEAGRDPAGFYVSQPWKSPEFRRPWFPELCAREDFQAEVRKVFSSFAGAVDLAARAEALRGQIAAAWTMDHRRWGQVPTQWEDYLVRYDTLEEHVAALTAFFTARTDFLRSAWIDGQAYLTIRCALPDITLPYVWLSVRPGDLPPALPQPQKGPPVTAWINEDTGKPFDPAQPVTEDLRIRAAEP
jgi:hypothetical protein